MTAANPLVAPRHDTTSPWAGVWIAEDVDTLVAGFRSASWIDVTIGGFGTTMDTLGLIVDPIGTVAQWGVAWLIEHVKPLSDALDWLAGDPDQISAHAQTWRNVAGACGEAATSLANAVRTDLAAWSGLAAGAYRARAQQQYGALDALSRAANGLALITEGAGLLVALVRSMVRDLIAGFVSTLAVRLPEWSAEEGLSLGIATPLVVEQVSVLVAEWTARIARLLRALIASLRRLVPIVRRLIELIDELRKLLRGLAHSSDSGHTRMPEPSSRSPEPGPGRDHHPPANAPADLPDFSSGEIPDAKITSYVMNPEHPTGKNKYRVINSTTGLDTFDVAEIRRQILEGAREATPVRREVDEFGQRWSVDVTLTGPRGTIVVRTGWIVPPGSDTPRLTTISFPPKREYK